MSIRFNCLACRMVLKVNEMIVQERKVRCTGCGIVLLLKPDPSSPTGIAVSLPEQELGSKRKTDKELARKRNQILIAIGIVVLVAAGGLYWTFKPPSDRASVSGEVLLDEQPLERGRIIFQSETGMKVVSVDITKGYYSVSAYNGPYIGKNKVRIHADVPTGKTIEKAGGGQTEEYKEGVAAKFNVDSTEILEVTSWSNRGNYKVTSK